jgi:hypothetical protein
VVIRPKASHSLCLPINTYQGKATSNTGVSAHDHAAIIPIGTEVQLHPDEQALTKAPIYMKVEDSTMSIDPMSRINFGRVYALESNHKVRNIGRVATESMRLLEEHFTDALQITRV